MNTEPGDRSIVLLSGGRKFRSDEGGQSLRQSPWAKSPQPSDIRQLRVLNRSFGTRERCICVASLTGSADGKTLTAAAPSLVPGPTLLSVNWLTHNHPSCTIDASAYYASSRVTPLTASPSRGRRASLVDNRVTIRLQKLAGDYASRADVHSRVLHRLPTRVEPTHPPKIEYHPYSMRVWCE